MEAIDNIFKVIKAFKQVYFPDVSPNLGVLAAGTRFVPGPPTSKPKAPKKEEPEDAYIISEDTKTFGFNSNKVIEKHEGSEPYITDQDVLALHERKCWAGQTKRGIKANKETANCKKLWHEGAPNIEIMSALNKSQSWVEHRVAAFSAALLLKN